jgi:hypothetical protein
VEDSGVYYVVLVSCTGQSEFITTTATVSWKNPFGHLSADKFPFLFVYGVLAGAYIVTAIIWFVLTARHWREILSLQHCIAGVIALGILESTIWYFQYLVYNLEGETHMGAVIVGVLVSTLKRTVSRLLVLVVSLGFGVVKPTLGTTKYKVGFLGALYFCFSAALAIAEVVDNPETGSSGGLQLFLIFPVALLDTIFYWWIWLALFRTITQLEDRNQTLKLRMYRSLFKTLLASGILSTFVSLAQLIVMVGVEREDDEWRVSFMWAAFWHFLYLAVLLAIVHLWRPTANNTRYAFVDLSHEFDDNAISLQPLKWSGVGDILFRRKQPDADGGIDSTDFLGDPTIGPPTSSSSSSTSTSIIATAADTLPILSPSSPSLNSTTSPLTRELMAKLDNLSDHEEEEPTKLD